MLPQITPPRAETTPVIAHASAKYRSTLIPIAIATCWLSATARIAIPLRDFRKNQPKTPRKTRLTDAPRSWIGGMNRGPTMNGSSLIGSASGFVSPPRERAHAAQDGGETDRRHDDGDDGPPDEAPKHHAFEPESEPDHPQEARGHREPERGAVGDQADGDDEARDHDELTLGEVNRVGRLVDEDEPERDQRVHEPDEDPVGHQEHEEPPVDLKHARPPLRRPPRVRATGARPAGHPRR